ncbi:MAG: hypothetical protein AB7O97_02965 [Planctomycetota bacterium]
MTGVVVYDDGTPVAGLDLMRLVGPYLAAAATTDTDGAFVLQRGPDEVASRVRVVLYMPEQHHQPRWLEWSHTPVRVVLARPARLDVSIVDAAGVLERNLSVTCEPAEALPRRQIASWELAHHGSGWTGTVPCALLRLEFATGWAPGTLFRVSLEPTDAVECAIRLMLPTARGGTVRITDPEGRPVAGAMVRVVAQQPIRAEARGCRVMPPEHVQDLQTNAAGQVRVVAFGDEPVLSLRVSHTGFADLDVDRASIAAGAPLEFRLSPAPAPATASGVGRVFVPDEFRDELAGGRWQIRLVRPDGGGGWEDVAADGTFAFEGYRPGVRAVHLMGAPIAATGVEVELAPGTGGRCTIDLRHLRRVPTRLRVRVGGATPAGEIDIESVDPPSAGARSAVQVRTDAQGRCDAMLLPGRYRVATRVPQPRGVGDLSASCYSAPFEVEAGAAAEREVSVGSVSLRVRLVGADGDPVCGLECRIRGLDNWAESDGDGGLRGEVPPGEHVLEFLGRRAIDRWWSAGGDREEAFRALTVLGRIEVGDGAVVDEVFVVPAAERPSR